MQTVTSSGLSPNVTGCFWVFASTLAFTAMMTLVKYLGEDYPAAVQCAYRQLASVTLLSPWLLARPRRTMSTPRPLLLLCVVALSTLGLVLSLYSYQVLPFAEANALSFTRMLWIVPLAMLLLRERVSAIQVCATAVGFCGVLVMLRPDQALTFDLGQIAALGAALLAALLIVFTKSLMGDHRPMTVLAWNATIGLLLSLPLAVLAWRWPSQKDFILLCAMGVLGVATQGLYYKGLTHGDAAMVSLVDYSRLVLAVGVGWALFSESPNARTLIGAAIIVAATATAGWSDMRRFHAARAVAGTASPPP